MSVLMAPVAGRSLLGTRAGRHHHGGQGGLGKQCRRRGRVAKKKTKRGRLGSWMFFDGLDKRVCWIPGRAGVEEQDEQG